MFIQIASTSVLTVIGCYDNGMKKLSRRTYIFLLIFIGALSILILLGVLYSGSRYNIFPQLVASYTGKNDAIDFPNINEYHLSPSQQKLVSILHKEYELQPSGTKYSEGVSEPWCADFVSWVFREAGAPLSNPNNGHWRIPGTHTLRDYYEQAGRFKSVQSGYLPRVGDVMLYDNPSPFGQHANIIIDNTDGAVTTIGGNEPGGIRVVRHNTPDGAGLIGYGVFE